MNGNVTSDGVHTFEFNAFQQLIAVKNNAGETIASYSYDENGKRKSTTVAGETVYYYYDGDNVLYETNENNTILRSYTYNEKGHPLTMTTNGQTYYYLTNYHGDVIGLTDLGGNIVASYSYDAWGNILTQSGALAEANPYRYASYRYDEQTKLYYLMARYYNPNNGAFLSVDPYRGDMDRPLSLNGYIYTSNNPVNFIDPDGMKEVNTGIGGPTASVPYNRWNEIGKGTGNAVKMTAQQATKAAERLGFKKTKYKSHGQPVFKKGNKYITPDVDGHNGGVWKMADSVKNLGSKNTRVGTYDAKLKRIGD